MVLAVVVRDKEGEVLGDWWLVSTCYCKPEHLVVVVAAVGVDIGLSERQMHIAIGAIEPQQSELGLKLPELLLGLVACSEPQLVVVAGFQEQVIY